MRKYLKTDLNITPDCSSVLTKVRLKTPHTLEFNLDPSAGSKGHFAQVHPYSLKYDIDPQANAELTSLRRTMMGRRPQIFLSVWSNEGLIALDNATLRRGDLHHIQADVIGAKLEHFVLATFILKHSLANRNVDALAWKSTDLSKGGIELVSSDLTIDMYGSAQKNTYQIAIDSLDTQSLKNRTILHYEFQLDDTLGEIFSTQGTITVTPDVYTRF